jgi:hypothetical protein
MAGVGCWGRVMGWMEGWVRDTSVPSSRPAISSSLLPHPRVCAIHKHIHPPTRPPPQSNPIICVAPHLRGLPLREVSLVGQVLVQLPVRRVPDMIDLGVW